MQPILGFGVWLVLVVLICHSPLQHVALVWEGEQVATLGLQEAQGH